MYSCALASFTKKKIDGNGLEVRFPASCIFAKVSSLPRIVRYAAVCWTLYSPPVTLGSCTMNGGCAVFGQVRELQQEVARLNPVVEAHAASDAVVRNSVQQELAAQKQASTLVRYRGARQFVFE